MEGNRHAATAAVPGAPARLALGAGERSGEIPDAGGLCARVIRRICVERHVIGEAASGCGHRLLLGVFMCVCVCQRFLAMENWTEESGAGEPH